MSEYGILVYNNPDGGGGIQLQSSRSADSVWTTLCSGAGTSVELHTANDILVAKRGGNSTGRELCCSTLSISYPTTKYFKDFSKNSVTANYKVLRRTSEFSTLGDSSDYGILIKNKKGDIALDSRHLIVGGSFALNGFHLIGSLSGNPLPEKKSSIVEGELSSDSSPVKLTDFVDMTRSFISKLADSQAGGAYVYSGYVFYYGYETGLSGNEAYFSGTTFASVAARRQNTFNVYNRTGIFNGNSSLADNAL